MERLELKKNHFGLKVACSKCNKTFNHNSIRTCTHPASQKYKVVVYKKNGQVVTENLQTTDYVEACVQAIQIKSDVKNQIVHHRKNNPTIIELADDYLDFKKGIGVLPMYHKILDKKYIDSIEVILTFFLVELKRYGISPENDELLRVTPDIGNNIYNTIMTTFGVGSYRTKFTLLRNFYDWCIEERQVKVKNIWKKVKFPKNDSLVEAISVNEFNLLIEEIKKGSLIVENTFEGKIKRREVYRDYLVTAYFLAIYTGLRRAELINLKWNDLGTTKDSKQLVFIVKNEKVENQLKESYKPKIVPVHTELMDLLVHLNVNDKIGVDEYIIHPERTYSLTSMKADISKSFLYYFRKVFPDRPSKPFKSLRRTYITHAYRALGKEVLQFTSHSGEKVLSDHYLDPTLLSKMMNLQILTP